MALIAGSLFLIVPEAWGWGTVAIYLALDLVVIVAFTAMSHRSGWNGRHRLALAGGAALAYGWHAFLQTPVDGTTGWTIRASNVVCLILVNTLTAFAARQQAKHVA